MRTVILLVIILAAVGVAAYFLSDVFSTKVDQAAERLADWTPENIAADPKGYLHFCKRQVLQTLQDLKASEIAISQTRGRMGSMQEQADSKIKVGQQALAELKKLYRSAEKDAAWPATWKDKPREKDWVKRQIVGLHKQVQQQQSLATKCREGLRRCDTELARVGELRAQANSQLGTINVAAGRIEVEELSGELKDRLIDIKAVVGALTSSAADVGGDLSLDALAREAETKVDEGAFEAIMKEE